MYLFKNYYGRNVIYTCLNCSPNYNYGLNYILLFKINEIND